MRLGVDIGGSKTASVVLGADGEVLASATAPSGRGPAEVVAQATHIARLAMGEVGGPGAITSVGACIPGLVDTAAGTVRHAVNLDVESLDLAAELGAALGIPVTVENDVKAAALGAHRVSGLDAASTLAYLNLGTGLAAAVVHAGEVVRGIDGVAGEIGHLPFGGDVLCACGQTGCLETMASGSALLRMWPDAAAQGFDLLGAASRGDGAAVLAAESLCGGVALAVQAIRAELRVRAAVSPFLASLALDERVSFLPSGVPVAAIGAASLVQSAAAPAETGGAAAWRS